MTPRPYGYGSPSEPLARLVGEILLRLTERTTDPEIARLVAELRAALGEG